MKIREFIDDFKAKKIAHSKINEHALEDYIKETLDVKEYLPFKNKQMIVETVVMANIKEENGIKKNDVISQYVGFVIAMLTSHTNLEFSDNPVDDYDLLAENGLLPQIIATFQESYEECNTLLKMVVASELEDNNVNVLVGKFLNGILSRLDIIGDALKDKFGDINIKDIFDANFKEEDLAKLTGFLDKYTK